jgi:predicted Holliday junction resolvase-like endonuclease
MPDLATLPPLLTLLVGIAAGFVVAWVYLQFWKARYSRDIRKDSVQRSRATISGQVHEQLLPYLPDFPFDPKDVRFLGAPVDLVVFDGLSAGELLQVVFVEVKTGASTLTGRERQVRDVIQQRKVSWQEIRKG